MAIMVLFMAALLTNMAAQDQYDNVIGVLLQSKRIKVRSVCTLLQRANAGCLSVTAVRELSFRKSQRQECEN
eukprot:3839653-Rhodomonas_salina.1